VERSCSSSCSSSSCSCSHEACVVCQNPLCAFVVANTDSKAFKGGRYGGP
jgi:hypothetical protein